MHQQSQWPRARRLLASTGCWLLLLTGLLVVPSSTAGAASTYLCTGYTACQKAGYKHHGYAGNNKTMYWRMYAGHNCTNYVAYRLVRAGMPNVRPWSGSGNASNWGAAMSKITDGTPRVGAVAWWRANVPGAGSSGHVAYVEQVVSPTEIVVSEDSWGGDFHWRRITKSGTGWPSGFIHFIDTEIVNVEPPKITDAPAVGSTISATGGRWQPAANLRYQWLADGKAVSGATTSSFAPPPALRGKRLALQVTAQKAGYTAASVVAPAPAPVAAGTLAAATPPVITGEPYVGEVLRAGGAGWQPAAESLVYRWLADGELIPQQTGPELELSAAHVGRSITARVTARAAGYLAAQQFSSPTAPVLAGTIEVTSPYRVTGQVRDQVQVGRRLQVAPGTVVPAEARVSYTWLRDGAPIPGATGTTYDVVAADLGRAISVQVDHSLARYSPLTAIVPAGPRVTTPAEMRVKAVGKPLRAVVRVKLLAPGTTPAGSVTMTVQGRAQQVALTGGTARVVLTGLKAGQRRIVVRYGGVDPVLATQGAVKVFVPKRPKRPKR
ncbi:CHAP domain-containing protein [Nocardioides ochotonae]|uniref:CHAP domain-containing protein n=1 Tax=Nocardioides ochotonae TaxID=2685869 RepID=UPI00140E5962